MNIILKEPYENGSYNIIQTWDTSYPVPDGYAVWPETLDTADYYAYNGFVVLTVENIDGVDTVISYVPNVKAWEDWKATLPEPTPEPELSVEERVTAIENAIEKGLSL